MVMENETGKIIGIDQNATKLFEVFKYDNGPDYLESGLFRIVRNGKIQKFIFQNQMKGSDTRICISKY